jgi:hypothetical protein
MTEHKAEILAFLSRPSAAAMPTAPSRGIADANQDMKAVGKPPGLEHDRARIVGLAFSWCPGEAQQPTEPAAEQQPQEQARKRLVEIHGEDREPAANGQG